jgi:uncharacterized membrane protein
MDFSPLLDAFLPTSGGLFVIRVILAAILVFFLPGFAWTLVLFRKVNAIERTAISIGLSIAVVTLCILVLNVLFNVKITGLNALIVIIVITIIPAAIYFIRRFTARNSEVSDGD